MHQHLFGRSGRQASARPATGPSPAPAGPVRADACRKRAPGRGRRLGLGALAAVMALAASPAVASAICPTYGNRLGNPGFETGELPWVATPFVIGNRTSTGRGDAARTGTRNAMFGTSAAFPTIQPTGLIQTLTQTVLMPAGCSVTINYWLNITSWDSKSVEHDVLTVRVNGVVDRVHSNRDSPVDLGSAQYVLYTRKLPVSRGYPIILSFTATENIQYPTQFLLDDVSVIASQPTS